MSRALAGLLLLGLMVAVVPAQEQAPNRREFTITAANHRFTPDRMDVSLGDIVRVTLTSEEQTYTFAIDAYRIVKRAPQGQPVTFEFRADKAGTFEFYCNLTSDPACRAMTGTLTVKAR
jgi:heme/copper-type cytochrome/quinol oxidase subunit 2